jgi:TolB-like protein
LGSARAATIDFGPFQLDLRGRTLCRNGQDVALGSRSLDILCALSAAGGALVTKDELMARVWPGLVVEDNTIQVHISALRKALSEDGGGRRYIVTVPGQGYRFVGGLDETPPAPPLPDKPSIAVLPFQNMSGDAEQDYFADGIVEDIITALARFPSLFVIARNSSFTYKGRAVDVRQVGRELGVRYVLEGSVRKSDDRVRITGQLIDATTGSHLWADRVDGRLADIFDLQDDIATRVVGAIAPKLERAEIERAKRKPTESLKAYDYHLRGLASFHAETLEANAEAQRLFYKAIELDPEFASAYGMAALCYCQRQRHSWTDDLLAERTETRRLAKRAAELGPDDAVALCAAGHALAYVMHETHVGGALVDRALLLNPNLGMAWSSSAWIRSWLGESDLAIQHAMRSMRLSPLEPLIPAMEAAIALAHLNAGRYDDASSWAERAFLKQDGHHGTIRILAISHAMAGRLERARGAIAHLRELRPTLRIDDVMDMVPLHRPADRQRYIDGLRIAGLPG